MSAKTPTKIEVPEALPEGMDVKNATEAAVWRALPVAGANDDGGPTAAEVANAVGLSTSQAGKMLKRLCEAGHATSTKDGRTLRYARTESAQVTTDPEHDTPREAKARADRAKLVGRGLAAPKQRVESLLDSGAAQSAAESPAEPTVAEGTPEPDSAPSDELSAAIATLSDDPRPTSAPPAHATPLGTDVMDAEEARKLTDDIKSRVADLLPLIVLAFRRRADLALGYGSWAAYCDAELGGVRMPIQDRERAVKMLTDVARMSARAVGAALNLSEATVRRDLASAGGADPNRTIAGLDGKGYDAAKQGTKPAKAAKAARVVPGSQEGDARTVPAEATETGTCLHCNWAITRSLTKPGAQWRHKDGSTGCAEFPGHHAEPVVQDAEPVTDVQGAIDALTDPAPAVQFADGSAVIAGGQSTVDVPLPDVAEGAVTRMLPGIDVETVMDALATFDWNEWELPTMPVPASTDNHKDTWPQWIRAVAEHVAESLGR